jgi:hypothetical protein
MDNIITGAISVTIFMAFVLGLAGSIKALPFVVIVVVVCAMLCTDFFQSAREGWKAEKQKKSRTAE